MVKAESLGWQATHKAKFRLESRWILVCWDPHAGKYLTRAEWLKVHSGGTPDLPADRYDVIRPA